MQTAVSILGVIAWIVLAACLLGVTFSLSCFFAEKLVNKIQQDSKDAIRAEIANDILHTAWWFSGSIEASEAMKAYGKNLMNGQRFCSSTVREEWRKEVAKSKETENKCPVLG